MSDFETQFSELFSTLDNPNERTAYAALDRLQKLLKDNGSDFNTIAMTLENGDVLFTPRLSALFRHLGDAPGPERDGFFLKLREFGGKKPIFKQMLASLNLISIAQEHDSLVQERDDLAAAHLKDTRIIDKITKENDKLRKPSLIDTIQNLFSNAAQNVAYRSSRPIYISTGMATAAFWTAFALTAASPLCAPILGLAATVLFNKRRSNNIEASAVYGGMAASAFTLFRLAALLTGHVQYKFASYDTPASMQNRVRMEAADKIVYLQENSNGTTSIRTTAIAQATYTEPSVLWFSLDKQKTVRCALKKYDHIGDQIFVHEWNDGKQGLDLALSLDTDGSNAIRVANAFEQRTGAKRAQNVKQANAHNL